LEASLTACHLFKGFVFEENTHYLKIMDLIEKYCIARNKLVINLKPIGKEQYRNFFHNTSQELGIVISLVINSLI